MFKQIDFNGINDQNDTFSSRSDEYDINNVLAEYLNMNNINANNFLISIWYLLNILIFSNIQSKKWYEYFAIIFRQSLMLLYHNLIKILFDD